MDSPELVAAFIEEFLDDDPEMLKLALKEVAQSVEFEKLADQMGIKRQTLYTMLSKKGNPTLKNLNRLASAVGCRLSFVPATKDGSVHA